MIQIILMMINFILGIYRVEKSIPCDLICELELNQSQIVTVGDFTRILRENNWIQSSSSAQWEIRYERDTFSNVLETTASIDLNGAAIGSHYSSLILYTQHIGGVEINPDDILLAEIEMIQIPSAFTILDSLLIYGLPSGGMVLPIYTQVDSERVNPCPPTSHYIGYYNKENIMIRATVKRPLLINMWTTTINMVYPVGETLEYNTFYTGRYEKMDHISCLQN